MKPLVTLVSPIYNSMPYLVDFLDCVENQTWRPLEVILVDDGSTDSSAEYLKQRKPSLEAAGLTVKLIFSSHQGQAAAMNSALGHINGELFTWCDSDDLMTPDSVEKKASWLLENTDTGMVRSNGIVMDADKGEILGESAREYDKCKKSVFDDLFTDRSYCYAGCYMIRTELFFACYPDKKMPVSPEGQNLQLLLPSASRSECGYIDECLHTYCRRHSGHSSMERSYLENLRRMENFTALRLAVLEYCDCDKEHYIALARSLEDKNKKILLYSAVQRARKDLQK